MNNYNTSSLYVSIQNRESQSGKFAAKDYGQKQLRSIRLSDEAWNLLESKAADNGVSRTDLIEEIARGKADEQAIILKAIKAFIEYQQGEFGENSMQKNKEFSTNSRGWDYFNKFAQLMEHEPWELGIGE